jgi:hypothetical protein
MVDDFVPEETLFGLVLFSLPIVLTAWFTARRLMRMIMRQRMQELVFMERLAWLRRTHVEAGSEHATRE